MSALIRVLLSTQSAQLQPGERAELTITVQNFGEVVDRYRITVEGVPPEWATVSRPELSLFPKDKDQVRITLQPPAGPETRAGRYDLSIHVTSQEKPDERTTVPFTLEVGALSALALTLDPPWEMGANEGKFSLRVANNGNADLTVYFEAMDPEGSCFYLFDPPQVTVPAGQGAVAHLSVRSNTPLPGKEPRVFSFTVTARATESPRISSQVPGQWQQVPPRRPLWPILVAAGGGLLLVAATVVGLFWYLGRPRPSPSPGPTAIVQATTAIPTKPVGVSPIEPTHEPTHEPTPVPTTAGPTVAPSPTPTPDLQAEIKQALWDFTWVRAEAEKALNPDLLSKVCVEPYLSEKTANIKRNIDDGVRWETWAVENFSITSLVQEGPDRVVVQIQKTETKVFFPKGSAVPDDETCSGAIRSYRNCTYGAEYKMLRQGGSWYVYGVRDLGPECPGKCQH